MCVGLSAKVLRIDDGTALIDASGAQREVSAELLDDLEPGDYVMVHAGIAIAKITGEKVEVNDAGSEERILMKFSAWGSGRSCRKISNSSQVPVVLSA